MKTLQYNALRIVAAMLATLPMLGCLGGDARVEIAAANLIDVASESLTQTLREYHNEILAADARREQDAILAFTTRITASKEDPEVINQHTRDFATALARLRADTQTEWTRHTISMDNLKTLQQTGATLRKLAIESLSLEDETKRYLTDALTQLKQYRTTTNATSPDQ